mgnify:CR=1 FL=1
MQIKEVQEKLKISSYTLRYYEKMGLIQPYRDENGYRNYSEEDIHKIERIMFLRDINVPIEDIKDILNNKVTFQDVLESHIQKVNTEIESLQYIKNMCEDLKEKNIPLLDQVIEDNQIGDKKVKKRDLKKVFDYFKKDQTVVIGYKSIPRSLLGIVALSLFISAIFGILIGLAFPNMISYVNEQTQNSVQHFQISFYEASGRLIILSMCISFIILLMGFELGKSSIEKIIKPEEVNFSIVSVVVLVIAISVKLWMAFFNKKLYKLTDNINLKAVCQDSLNDCIATGATVISLLISHFTGFHYIDGIVGLLVAFAIIYSGIGVLKDVLGPLLGQPPSAELVKSIEDLILSEKEIIGVHDLIVHDYGPGRIIASAHAEVPSNEDIVHIHDVIDNVEKKIQKQLNIVICIHLDPIDINNEEVNKYKAIAQKIIKGYNDEYSFHDFRLVNGETHKNLIFDLVIPFDKNNDTTKILNDIMALFKQYDDKINVVITIEHSFI